MDFDSEREKEEERNLNLIKNKPLNSDDLGEHDHFLIIFWISLCTFLVVAWLINDYWYKRHHDRVVTMSRMPSAKLLAATRMYKNGMIGRATYDTMVSEQNFRLSTMIKKTVNPIVTSVVNESCERESYNEAIQEVL
ncbi:Oidioi.mRNA.OKI2018_I69.chr1.g3624.t1.cds [Oikopleura dioica]|uniref:Oidioi.mRNA.OKI2018_I69.chr1.g3624.t1.cds n=1 Tax=Oikopleura dioica TaxID=34765 RepID=A0ABN7T096_OIKDI|nr:Oidioi.mRNA.OKI2018_I69.chr1.g3624.t1.cds [Oikopleura dioica]